MTQTIYTNTSAFGLLDDATKPSIDWEIFTPEVVAIARDQNGVTCAYTKRPEPVGAYWNAGVAYFAIPRFIASLDPGTCDWKDSLVMRPGSEDAK